MSFSISNNSLGNIMRQVCQIISDREQASIMGHVLLEGKKGNIRFTTVNEDTQITSRIPCTTTEEFTRTLPARRLASICQSLPQEADIQISFQKDRADLSSSIGSSKYTLHCLPSDDFYQINLDGDDEDLSEANPLKLPRADFLYLISKTQSCMGVADVRQYLNGVLLDILPDKIRMVATDGNRMAVCDKSLAGKDKHQAILSRRVIERLPRILHGKGDHGEDDDVSVYIGSNFMRLKWGDISISTRLVKGQYPDYQVAMPKVAAENQILVPHADFRAVAEQSRFHHEHTIPGHTHVLIGRNSEIVVSQCVG